jgi:hypothetical protein
MKAFTPIIFLMISLSGFSQGTDIVQYESIYKIRGSSLHYVLYLTGTHEFFLYGGGTYQWDKVYPITAFYGKYRGYNDTLYFDFLPLDSILLETDHGFYNKLAFYGDTIWVEKQKGSSPDFSTCIKKGNKIIFPSQGFFRNNNQVFSKTGKPVSYTFSIQGKLPVELQQYVSNPGFSFENMPIDIYMAQYPVSKSSIDITSLDNVALDSFSVFLTDYRETSHVLFYTDKLYDVFAPAIVSPDSFTTNGVNQITLQYVKQHHVEWKYLNKNIPSHWPLPPKAKKECLTLDEYGRVIDFNNEKYKLKQKILKRHSSISYIEAYKTLIKSGYFSDKRPVLLLKDSLPNKATAIYNYLNIFTISDLAAIYSSYYNIPGTVFIDKQIKKHLSGKGLKTGCYISKAGFNADKTICFLPVQESDGEQDDNVVLVFERRLNEYVLTGRIENGTYLDDLQGGACEYYPDFRNYRLFY